MNRLREALKDSAERRASSRPSLGRGTGSLGIWNSTRLFVIDRRPRSCDAEAGP